MKNKIYNILNTYIRTYKTITYLPLLKIAKCIAFVTESFKKRRNFWSIQLGIDNDCKYIKKHLFDINNLYTFL